MKKTDNLPGNLEDLILEATRRQDGTNFQLPFNGTPEEFERILDEFCRLKFREYGVIAIRHGLKFDLYRVEPMQETYEHAKARVAKAHTHQ